MTRDGLTPLFYIRSYLQIDYAIIIDRHTLRRRLQWDERKELPMDAHCMILIRVLTDAKAREEGVQLNITVTCDGRSENICWAYPQWLESMRLTVLC